MTVVDLDHIGVNVTHRQEAIMWLFDRYGPAGDVWNIDKLTYVKFKEPKHATYFILRWT